MNFAIIYSKEEIIMKGFSVDGLIYFVVGFTEKSREDVLIGAYNKVVKKFYVDYSGEMYGGVKEDFLKNGLKLNIIKVNGMGYDDFISMKTKDYVYSHCFIVDVDSIKAKDVLARGYVELSEKGVLSCSLGLSGDYVWSTGNLYELCNIYFEYSDFLDILDIKVLAENANAEETAVIL